MPHLSILVLFLPPILRISYGSSMPFHSCSRNLWSDLTLCQLWSFQIIDATTLYINGNKSLNVGKWVVSLIVYSIDHCCSHLLLTSYVCVLQLSPTLLLYRPHCSSLNSHSVENYSAILFASLGPSHSACLCYIFSRQKMIIWIPCPSWCIIRTRNLLSPCFVAHSLPVSCKMLPIFNFNGTSSGFSGS